MTEVRVTALGGPEVLQAVPQALSPETAVLADDELLVRVSKAGLNFIDCYFRQGIYPSPAPLPFVTGSEGAGTVVRAGAAAAAAALLGRRVAFFRGNSGASATYAKLRSADAFAVPDGVSNDVAAAAMLQGATAHYLTHSCTSLKNGSVVLVHAAAGGTGLLISQMAKILGATVVGTCGGAEKAALAKRVGRADVVVDYVATPNWAEEVRRLFPGGVDAVYDGVGAATFAPSLTVLRPRGAMVTFGNASGVVPPISPLELTKHGSISLQRPTLKDFSAPGGEIEGRIADVFRWIASGELSVTVGHVFPLVKAAEAHALLESRKSTGKILLDCE